MSWGFAGFELWNPFAYRSKHPSSLLQVPDPIGPHNDAHILAACEEAPIIVVGWGTSLASKGRRGREMMLSRVDALRKLLVGFTLHCWEITGQGFPRHPLYIKGDVRPILYH